MQKSGMSLKMLLTFETWNLSFATRLFSRRFHFVVYCTLALSSYPFLSSAKLIPSLDLNYQLTGVYIWVRAVYHCYSNVNHLLWFTQQLLLFSHWHQNFTTSVRKYFEVNKVFLLTLKVKKLQHFIFGCNFVSPYLFIFSPKCHRFETYLSTSNLSEAKLLISIGALCSLLF